MKPKPLSMPPAYATIGPRPQPGGPRTALQELYAEQCEREKAEIERRARRNLHFWLPRLIARARDELTSKE
jgi:hypothetical protein